MDIVRGDLVYGDMNYCRKRVSVGPETVRTTHTADSGDLGGEEDKADEVRAMALKSTGQHSEIRKSLGIV